MVKIIQRTTDNKYLNSVETETWVDDIRDAFEMTYQECEQVKLSLEGVLLPEQIKEIVNMRKDKSITQGEKKELLNLLKNR